MFLDKLTKEEKITYLALAKSAAEANGEIAAEEDSLIDDYCREMAISVNDLKVMPENTAEETIKVFSNSLDSHKRIVLFESIAFMYVDGSYDEKERSFVNEFAEKIGFGDEEVEEITLMAEKYVKCVSEIGDRILRVD